MVIILPAFIIYLWCFYSYYWEKSPSFKRLINLVLGLKSILINIAITSDANINIKKGIILLIILSLTLYYYNYIGITDSKVYSGVLINRSDKYILEKRVEGMVWESRSRMYR